MPYQGKEDITLRSSNMFEEMIILSVLFLF